MKKFLIYLLILTSLHGYGEEISYTIPFELHENRILIAGTIENIKCEFLFDTGAAFSSVEQSFLEKYNLKIEGLDLVLTGGFEVKNYSVRGQEIKKYDPKAKHLAVLGLDFFADYHFEIDYHSREIYLYKTRDHLADEQHMVALSRHTNNLYLYNFFYVTTEIKVNGTLIKGDFMVDTGSGRTITLLDYNNKYESLKSDIRRSGQFIAIEMSNSNHFAAGLNNIILTKNTEFLFGGRRYNKLIVDISNVSLKDFEGNSFVGIIGGGFLQNFKISQDREKDQLLVLPTQGKDSVESMLYTDGFRLTKKNKRVVITQIFSNSAIPIELGDEILEVNGQPIRKIDLDELRANKQQLGNEFTYKIKRGTQLFSYSTEVIDFYRLL